MRNIGHKVNIKIYIRAIIAILLMVAWISVAFSGIVLWLAPEGRQSGRIPLIFELTKSDWKDIHFYLAMAALGITAVHIVVDWKTLCALIKYMVSLHRENTDILK